jgi:hypothetical protein
MHLKAIIKTIEKFTSDNSPLLLTAIGAAGTVSSAILAGHASWRAAQIVRDAEDEKSESFGTDSYLPLSNKERAKLVWKLYIPSVSVAAVSVTCIIMANRIGTRRAAAMATAYTILDESFGDYKKKVVEKLGEGKERAVRDEVAQDKVARNPASQSTMIVTGKGTVPCLDAYNNRWFESDYDTVREAVIQLNEKIINSMESSATVNDFYDLLGIPSVRVGDEMGWTSDQILKVDYTTTFTDDNRPGFVITFRTEPVRNPFRTH